jgi:hypothetical protein
MASRRFDGIHDITPNSIRLEEILIRRRDGCSDISNIAVFLIFRGSFAAVKIIS